MVYLLRSIVFTYFLFVVAAANAVNLPVVGTKLEGIVQVGIYAVPLPTGQWTVLEASNKNESRKIDVKKSLTGHLGVLSVVLAQSGVGKSHNPGLNGLVLIEANANYEPENYSNSRHRHEEKHQFYKEEFYTSCSARGKHSHLAVGPHFLCSKECGGVIKQYLKDNNLVSPKSPLVDVAFMFARHGGFLMVQYLFNPEMDGVTLDHTDAKSGKWHPEERDELDSMQKEYLERFSGWAQEMKTRLLEVVG